MFHAERVFMPIPQQLGRGRSMGRGPYEKSGMLEDNALPPLRTVTSNYEIFFPVVEKETETGTVRTFPSNELTIEVKLWYLPFGTMDDDHFLWSEASKTVSLGGSTE